MKKIRNPWASLGLIGIHRDTSDKDKTEKTEGKHPYWPTKMGRKLKMRLRILKRGSQNNLDRITKRTNDDNTFIEDNVNNIYKEALDQPMVKYDHGDNIVKEETGYETFLNKGNYDSSQVNKDENMLQKEDDSYDKFQGKDKYKYDKENEAGNTLQEREEDPDKGQFFQEEENNTLQDDDEAKYFKGRNEVNKSFYKLCTSFNCWKPRMLKVWKKRDGGRATSGSWSPSGKRNGGRLTLGSWNHFWNHMREILK